MKSCIPVRLDALVHAAVRGDDAVAFLQGQLSNDLRLLHADRAQIGSYNSAKGRMLAVMHLLRIDDAIVLELHRDIAAATCKRLRMFVLRAKVTIDEASIRAFGLIGPGADACLARLGLPVPAGTLACAHDSQRGITVVRRFGDTPRYSVHAAPEVLAPLADAVGPLQDDAHWRRSDIEAGVPTVYAATADRFVPQTANLERLGGISFDKGCYTGQEIIARLHYLGQVKRRLFVARSDRPAPSPGDEIRTAEGTVAGEVVDAVDDGGTGVASVIVQLAHADATLHLADGRGLHLLVQTSA